MTEVYMRHRKYGAEPVLTVRNFYYEYLNLVATLERPVIYWKIYRFPWKFGDGAWDTSAGRLLHDPVRKANLFYGLNRTSLSERLFGVCRSGIKHPLLGTYGFVGKWQDGMMGACYLTSGSWSIGKYKACSKSNRILFL